MEKNQIPTKVNSASESAIKKLKDPVLVKVKPNGCMFALAIFVSVALFLFLCCLASMTVAGIVAACLIYICVIGSCYIMAKGFGSE